MPSVSPDRAPSDNPEDFEMEPRDWHPDVPPEEDQPQLNFTEEQANLLQEYIWLIRDGLGLHTWDIFLTSVAAKPDTNAAIHPVYGRHVAALSVNQDWYSYSPEAQRNTIVHEILHVVHNRQSEVIRTSKQHDAVWSTFQRETELMVDHLAGQIDEFFPLPPQPESMETTDGK